MSSTDTKNSDVRYVQKCGIICAVALLIGAVITGLLFSLSAALVGIFAAATIFFLSIYAAAHLEDPKTTKSELLLKPVNALYWFFCCFLLLIVAIVAVL